ncbi:hypothetical protein CLOLEP_02774 [[Clostridium] leptum DSM 753]|uniref:Uncharacterized protein n=1 Tax=[Clostridium] leptum DSM 753 TaxID=428125 RepID=A7VW10_9FIRM|nr:hypothetical protein CLOLEP_02774 [[Clostridium] leptum DSM 753]
MKSLEDTFRRPRTASSPKHKKNRAGTAIPTREKMGGR